jgi:hypothetical protein
MISYIPIPYINNTSKHELETCFVDGYSLFDEFYYLNISEKRIWSACTGMGLL